MSKAVDTLIRNLLTGLNTVVADEMDGNTNRDRLAFRLGNFKATKDGKSQAVYVIPKQSVSRLAETPVDLAKIAKALDDRQALVTYARAPGKDGRQRMAERSWPSVPGVGEVRSIIVSADAIGAGDC